MYEDTIVLGAENQWRDVNYTTDEGDGFIRCDLCGTGSMLKRSPSIASHFNGSRHRIRYHTVKRNQERKMVSQMVGQKIEATQCLNARTDQLGLASWKRHVHSHMYLNACNGEPHILASCTESFTNILKLLEKYETMELTSLLELAILKHAVCSRYGFSSMQELYDYKALEDDFDPSEFLRSQGITCGSNVIIPLVMKFLLKSDKEE
jgi:hypothetical protein